MNYIVTDQGFGTGPHIVINPKTGAPYFYMTRRQAEVGASKRPGTKAQKGRGTSWILILE